MLTWDVHAFPRMVATDARPDDARACALLRLRAEFTEMPGLSLTVPQAQRLCGLTDDSCAWALDALVAQGVLRKNPAGRYVRA